MIRIRKGDREIVIPESAQKTYIDDGWSIVALGEIRKREPIPVNLTFPKQKTKRKGAEKLSRQQDR